MSTTPPNAFGQPIDHLSPGEQIDFYNSEIKKIQDRITANPNLPYSDIMGSTMAIVNLRRKARNIAKPLGIKIDIN